MIGPLLGTTALADSTDKHQDIITQCSVREQVKHAVSILLAKDTVVNQKLATALLNKAGYQVTVAHNGRKAVDMYAATPELCDLIFMDMQMPELSGFDATQKLRLRGFNKIPIVAMAPYAMKATTGIALPRA